MAAELEAILAKLLVPDNAVIKQATSDLKALFTRPGATSAIVEVLQLSQEPTIRQYASILLRRRIKKQWKSIASDLKQGLKKVLLDVLTKESVNFVRGSICQLIGTVAKNELDGNKWPELMQCIAHLVQSLRAIDREIGFQVLCSVCEVAPHQLQPFYKELFPVFVHGLEDKESVQCAFLAIKSITPLVPYFGSDEEVLLKPLLAKILDVIKVLLREDQDKANEALDLFDELVQVEVGIIVPFVQSLVEFCMQVMSSSELDDGIRTKALYLVCWACRRKGKVLLKAKLLGPLLQLLLSLMMIPDEDDDACNQSQDESIAGASGDVEDSSLCAVAGQALDLLALHLPPDKLIPPLMTLLQPMFASENPFEKKAAYLALGNLAEGCADFLRNRYLQDGVLIAMKGLSDASAVSRNAALYALGQLSEHVQPEVGKQHKTVIPALLMFMQTIISTSDSKNANSKDTLTKLFYALEKFTEGLEKEVVVSYIPSLMSAILHVLAVSKDSHSTELAISAIGALVTSAQEHLSNYFPVIMDHLKTVFQQPLTLDSLDIHAQAVDTLGALARNIGTEYFRPVADECMQFGIKLVTESEDPDLRRCTYGLFASLSVALKGDMANYMSAICPKMIESLQSTEGIVAEYSTSDPSFLLEDFDEEDITTEENGENEDDDDEAEGFSVKNSYMEEKEDTINSFAEIAENIGVGIVPYLEDMFKEVFLLVDYPHANVRKAAVTGTCRLCVVVHKLAREHKMDATGSVLEFTSRALPTAINIINEDDDRYVVLATVEVLEDFLKELQSDAFSEPRHVDEAAYAILNVLKGKTNCQRFVDDEEGSAAGDEDDTQAELDQMLVERTGDLLPALATAIGGEAFKPYFIAYLPELMRRGKKQCLVSERSFAAGTIAECIQGMGLTIAEFVPTIAPLLLNLLHDEEDEVRSNAAFALGVLAEHGKHHVTGLYEGILQALFTVLNKGQPAFVKDNICGAVARMIMTSPESLPLPQVLPVFVQCLPIEEDETENNTAMACLAQLYSALPDLVMPFMDKLLPCMLKSLAQPDSGLKPETRHKIMHLLQAVRRQHPEAFDTTLLRLQLPANLLELHS